MNDVAKIADGLLFGDMLAATFERHFTPNMFAYRTMTETEDAIMWVHEGIICENKAKMKIAVLSWDIKGLFDDLPHAVVLKSVLNTGASV